MGLLPRDGPCNVFRFAKSGKWTVPTSGRSIFLSAKVMGTRILMNLCPGRISNVFKNDEHGFCLRSNPMAPNRADFKLQDFQNASQSFHVDISVASEIFSYAVRKQSGLATKLTLRPFPAAEFFRHNFPHIH